MTDNNVKEISQPTINTPLDTGKKTLKDLLDEKSYELKELSFINDCILFCNDNYLIPSKRKFLIKYNDFIVLLTVNKKKSSVTVKKITNFIIQSVKEIIYHTNPLLGKEEIKKSFLITIKNENGNMDEIELKGDSKSDYNKFQSSLSEKTNGNIFSGDKDTFKEFFSLYISPDKANKVDVYSNPGVLNSKTFLYSNALYKDGETYYADNSGYIKLDEKHYIKLDCDTKYLPFLAKSSKSVKEISGDFITNIIESFGENAFMALMTIGHMVMSPFFKHFIKTGVPTLILFGESGTGKSTIIKDGLFINCMPGQALISGGSTTKSTEFLSSRYNAIIVCIDDLKSSILLSDNFTELIKSMYNGTTRTRMKNYGKEVENIQVNSPLAYSTNEKLPQLKEVHNRLNIVEMFGKSFDPSKFNYFETNEDNIKELSLIHPEILKFDIEFVENTKNEIIKFLKSNVKEDTQERVINNVAYACTGLKLLMNISGKDIDGFEKQLIEYTQNQIKKYDDVKNVVDKVLSEIPVQYSLGHIQVGLEFRIESRVSCDKIENFVCFHKGTLITKLNQCNSHDKSKYIDEDMFNSYYKNHPRYSDAKTVRYKKYMYSTDLEDSRYSVCFCVDGLDDYAMLFENNIPEATNTPEAAVKNPFCPF